MLINNLIDLLSKGALTDDNGDPYRMLQWKPDTIGTPFESLGVQLRIGAKAPMSEGTWKCANGAIVRVHPLEKSPNCVAYGGYGFVIDINDDWVMYVQPGMEYGASIQWLHPKTELKVEGDKLHCTPANLFPEYFHHAKIEGQMDVGKVELNCETYQLDLSFFEGWAIAQQSFTLVAEKPGKRVILGHGLQGVELVESALRTCCDLVESITDKKWVECRFDIISPMRERYGFDALVIELD